MPATTDLTTRATELLHELAGPDAVFREHQLEAIADLVEDRARVLCVQRTGWGKSAVYFIATALLRERGTGPALIVSPLLALMRNQIAAAQRLGIRAHTVNSTNRDAWDEIQALLHADAVDLLLISPERLNNPQFRARMLPVFAQAVGLLVVDEAHCISDWGHDFRPDYRRIADMLERLPERRRRPVHDGDRQRPRRRRRRGAAAHRPQRRPARRLPRPARAHEPALRGRRAARPGRPARLAGDLPRRDAGLGDRLHADQARRRAGRPMADRTRRRRRGLHRGDRYRAADRRRGPAAGQRPEVRRRHQRARHGLRQARPRLRRALPGAGLGHRLLPAGRPRRPRDRTRRGRPAARRRGSPHPGLLHRAGVPAPRARRPRARPPRRGRLRGRLHAGAHRDRQPRPWADRRDAEGARRRGRRLARRQPLAAGDRQRLGLRHRALRAHHRAAPPRAGHDGELRRRRALPHARAAGGARRSRSAGLRTLLGLHAAALRRAAGSRARARGDRPPALAAAQARNARRWRPIPRAG